MTTDELIHELRDQAEVIGPGTECHLLNEAADWIEENDERLAIVLEVVDEMEKTLRVCADQIEAAWKLKQGSGEE